jgi:hypothetical protein
MRQFGFSISLYVRPIKTKPDPVLALYNKCVTIRGCPLFQGLIDTRIA